MRSRPTAAFLRLPRISSLALPRLSNCVSISVLGSAKIYRGSVSESAEWLGGMQRGKKDIRSCCPRCDTSPMNESRVAAPRSSKISEWRSPGGFARWVACKIPPRPRRNRPGGESYSSHWGVRKRNQLAKAAWLNPQVAPGYFPAPKRNSIRVRRDGAALRHVIQPGRLRRQRGRCRVHSIEVRVGALRKATSPAVFPIASIIARRILPLRPDSNSSLASLRTSEPCNGDFPDGDDSASS